MKFRAAIQTNDSKITRRGRFWRGVLAVQPIQLGVIPFAAITGIVAVEVGLSFVETMGMSVILFAGASQIVILQLFAQGAPLFIVILSGLVVNLRFMMYSASIAPYFQTLARRVRWPLAYVLTDQGYAVAIAEFTERPDRPYKPWYYAGGAVYLWTVWQLGTVAGFFLGRGVPESWSLDFVFPVMFLALAVPALRDGASIVAAVVASVIAVAGVGLPLNTGLLVAAISGIFAGLLAEAWMS